MSFVCFDLPTFFMLAFKPTLANLTIPNSPAIPEPEPEDISSTVPKPLVSRAQSLSREASTFTFNYLAPSNPTMHR
jgi:hypothetical protein